MSAARIRQATSGDADGIARIFLESASYHAKLDPERYSVPAVETISARYRQGQQHPQDGDVGTTFVAEIAGIVVGFIDARLDRSLDPMHRELIYCHIAEIAVAQEHQNQGVGEQLMLAVEEWGRRRGAQFASLEHHSANVRAGAFYERRMGYTPAAIIGIKRL